MYPLTDRIRHDICWRFGRLVKYFNLGGFIWNKDTQLFETLDGYSSFQYYYQHISCCLLIFITSTSTWYKIYFEELPESDPTSINENSNLLAILSNILVTTLITFIVSAGFVHLKYKSDFPLALNQAFLLAHHFKRMLKINEKKVKGIPTGDLLVRLIIYIPCFFPIAFAMSLFHPSDPIHMILIDLFEIEVKPSFFIFLFVIFEMWAVVCFIGDVLVFCLLGMIQVFLAGYWLEVALPMNVYHRNVTSGSHNFRTSEVGNITQDQVINVYRSLQYTFTVSHNAFCNTRLASHSIGMIIVAVVSSFTLIRYNYLLFDNSAMGISIILNVAFVTVFLMYKYECFFLDDLETRWMAYKSAILNLTKPSSEIHKVAKSFRPITLKTGGPYFNVNRSTYLEWCNQILDNLVSLLVSFK